MSNISTPRVIDIVESTFYNSLLNNAEKAYLRKLALDYEKIEAVYNSTLERNKQLTQENVQLKLANNRLNNQTNIAESLSKLSERLFNIEEHITK